MTTAAKLIIAYALLRVDDIGRSELLCGKPMMSPAGASHAMVVSRSTRLLGSHIEARSLGEIFAGEGGFPPSKLPSYRGFNMTGTIIRRPATVCIATLIVALFASAQEEFTLKWQESNISQKVTGYRPQTLMLTPKSPEALKKAPAGLAAPQYGAIKIGPAKNVASILVIADDVEGKPTRLFVDGNNNGDLTDEEPHGWTERRTKNPDGNESIYYHSDAMIPIPFASGSKMGQIRFYRLEGKLPNGQPRPRNMIAYYSDYGLVGEVKVADKTLAAVLKDAGCTGDFSLSDSIMHTPLIWLDIDGDGKAGRGESFLVNRPFEFQGKWWAVAGLTPEGSFKIVESSKPAAPAVERPAGPDLSPGQKAPAFTAKLSNGKTVKFPDDYKGKVVLLDFWATWCGPCIAELPNVIKAYETYHDQGMEILGISLDRAGAEQKLATFTKEKNMPWPQVYDGKFWQAEVARTYGIHAIPHMLLVDGDTGIIIANKDIRGPKLAPAIAKALADKQK